MTKKLIVVAAILCGKTSLTERIGARMGGRLDTNLFLIIPICRIFYADMKTWSFHLQVYFLGHRARQYLDMANDPKFCDPSTGRSMKIPISLPALCTTWNNLSERDYMAYRRLFELVVE